MICWRRKKKRLHRFCQSVFQVFKYRPDCHGAIEQCVNLMGNHSVVRGEASYFRAMWQIQRSLLLLECSVMIFLKVSVKSRGRCAVRFSVHALFLFLCQTWEASTILLSLQVERLFFLFSKDPVIFMRQLQSHTTSCFMDHCLILCYFIFRFFSVLGVKLHNG